MKLLAKLNLILVCVFALALVPAAMVSRQLLDRNAEAQERYQDILAVEADFRRLLQGGVPDTIKPVPTAVQETVFISSPDLGAQDSQIVWDEADMKKITGHLADYIGPLAKVLIRNTRVRAHGRDELCHELAGHIRASEDRKAFLRACVAGEESSITESRASLSDPALDSTQPISSGQFTAPAATFSLDDDQTATAVGLLARAIGPMAKILVKRETAKAGSLADLTSRLADSIPDDSARNTFTEAMRRLG